MTPKPTPKPTPAQAETLKRMAGGLPLVRLIRVNGGFWTTKADQPAAATSGAALSMDYKRRAPSWWVGFGTVLAMERRGWLVVSGANPNRWAADRALTEAGLKLAKELTK